MNLYHFQVYCVERETFGTIIGNNLSLIETLLIGKLPARTVTIAANQLAICDGPGQSKGSAECGFSL